MWALHQLRRRIVGCHCPGRCGSGSHGHHQGLPVERRCSVTSASAGRTSCFDHFMEVVAKCRTSSSTASSSRGQVAPLDDRCKNLSCKRCRSLCIQTILVVVNFIFLVRQFTRIILVTASRTVVPIASNHSYAWSYNLL